MRSRVATRSPTNNAVVRLAVQVDLAAVDLVKAALPVVVVDLVVAVKVGLVVVGLVVAGLVVVAPVGLVAVGLVAVRQVEEVEYGVEVVLEREEVDGAGGGGRRGGGRQANAGMEGPLNFDYRGMDAPLAPVSYTLYDPMIEGTEPSPNNTFHVQYQPGMLPISGQFQLPVGAQPPPMPKPLPLGPVVPLPGTAPAIPAAPGTTAPRGIITAYSLPGLDTLVIRAESEQDLKIILDLIDTLRELSKGAQPRMQVVQLEWIDPNIAADFLTQLFSRIVIPGPGGIYAAPTTPGAAPGGFGAAFGGAQQAAQNKGFYFLAMPQLNSMLVVGPEARFEDIFREIRRIDVPNSEYARPKPFKLQKASAQIVATQIQTFFNTRFPGQPVRPKLSSG